MGSGDPSKQPVTDAANGVEDSVSAPAVVAPGKRGVAKSYMWASLGRLSLQASNLVALVLTSRLLTPAQFGLFAPVTVIATIAYAVSDSAFGTALIQRRDIDVNHIRSALWLSLIAGTGLAILVAAGAPLIEQAFRLPGLAVVAAVSAVMLVPRLLGSVPSGLLQRQMRFKAIAGVAVTASIFGKVLPTIVLALMGFGVWSLVAGYILQCVVETTLLFVVARPSLAMPTDWSRSRDLIAFGSRFMLIRIFNQLALQMDTVIVGRQLGAAALGLYSRAFALMVIPVWLFGGAGQQVLFPTFAGMQDDIDAQRKQFSRAVEALCLIVMPVSAILALTADSIILVVLGHQWSAIILPARIMFAAVTFRVGYMFAETVSYAMAKLGRAIVRQCIYAALIVTGVFFGSRWGLVGATLGLSIALAVFYLISLQAVVALGVGHWRDLVLFHLRGLVVTTLAIVPAAFVASHTGHSLLMRASCDLAGAALAGAILVAILVWAPASLVGNSPMEMRLRLSAITSRFWNRKTGGN